MRMRLEFLVTQKLMSITMETNSLALKNIIDRVREVSWTISMEVKKIQFAKREGLQFGGGDSHIFWVCSNN